MADPIRLYSEFTDDLGGDWRVNIHDANFTGTTQTFVLGADGFVLRYAGNNEDRYQPVIGSEVTFTLMEQNSTHTGFMDDLATAAEQRFSVSIYKDPDGDNDFWWGGVLYPEQVVRPFEYFPVANTITAADDLGNLQNIDYNNDGSAYTGQASAVGHLLNCLNKLRSTQLWGATDDFLYYVNDFTASNPNYTGSDLLEDTRISHYGLYNPDSNNDNQYYSAFQVLENLAKVFNARVFQAQGKFWFLPVGAQKYSTSLTVEGTYKDGTTITQQSIAAAKSFDSTFERLNGYEYTYLPPLKEVTRTRRYNGNWPLIFDSVYTESDFGTTLSDTDIDYDSGTQFAISGTFNYEFDGDGTTTGNERVGRVLLRLRIQVGTKYLKRTASFSGVSQETFFDPLQVLEYTSHEYTATTWESSASYYEIVSPIFDVNEGGSFTIPLFIETPPLAADENGIDVRVSLFGRDDEGNNATAYVATADADYNIVTLRADIFGDTALGDTVEFTATNSDEARGNIDQGEVLFGDAETNNADGIVRVIIGANAENISEWQSLNHTTTGVGINRLGVQEVLGGQRKATRVQRGSVYGSIIYPWQVIDDTDGDYALFQMTYTARDLTNEIEAFLLERDTSTTTGITGTAINDDTPITEDPIGPSAGVYEARLRMAGDGVAQFGSRDQRVNREISNRAGGSTSVSDEDLHIVNTWTGANGTARIVLPPIAESYGRVIKFHSDDTISANTNVTLEPDANDTGTTIDGASSYDFDRAYDGITILGHTDDNWYIIQKKEKGGGGSKTTTPTLASISDFESTSTATITVNNYDSDAEYRVRLYDSNDNEVNHTITDNSNGTFTIATGLNPATGYTVTVEAVGFGELLSDTATSNTFESQAAQTQMRYWRLQITDSTMTPVANKKIALGEFRLYTQTGASGTPYPSNMTSATTPSPYVVTRGYQFSTYDAYLAFDGSGSSAGSMWWTLGNHAASNAWIQIDLGSSIDLGSGECRITTSGGWTDAEYAVLYGSNTGSFSGEERRMAFFQNIKTSGQSGGTFTTFTQAIT